LGFENWSSFSGPQGLAPEPQLQKSHVSLTNHMFRNFRGNKGALHQQKFPMFIEYKVSRSIHIHFAMVKHCPHIELIVFDGFQLLLHLQTTKTDHATLFFLHAHGEWRSHSNCVTAQR